ncbi:hypothetical protein [Micromonospora saelicesensis]|uniref:hypothetical protein n=1 Tax=Micromonospora saelicesensis TaxID=285676 RepID=UPI0011BF6F60|nr:hypothetical protein [Micromonospora saelicesensis]
MTWEWLAPVATGVVGVVGIAASAWTAASGRRSQAELLRHQIDGDLRKAHRQDKQALYARVLNELVALNDAGHRQLFLSIRSIEDPAAKSALAEAAQKFGEQIGVAGHLWAEVSVVAGPEVAEKVREVIGIIAERAFPDLEDGGGDAIEQMMKAIKESPVGLLNDLIAAMRADLWPAG